VAVGILGGRFDPPHLGHLALARTAVEHFGLDELHVTVVVDAAHKRSEASAEHRLAMARLTFAGIGAGLDVSVELEHHEYTVDALEAAGYDDPIFLIGADQLAAFATWKQPERVLELARLGVATRPGWQPEESSNRIEVFELEPHPVSSTLVRECVRSGEPVDELVVATVAAYIAAHDLYRDA
jgi:nicotinate-nucleotide adenylyltransferase